jgi:hypothetical protein
VGGHAVQPDLGLTARQRFFRGAEVMKLLTVHSVCVMPKWTCCTIVKFIVFLLFSIHFSTLRAVTAFFIKVQLNVGRWELDCFEQSTKLGCGKHRW